MARQFTFSKPTKVTHLYPDGRTERMTYGYFESVMITHENDLPVGRTVTLAMPTVPVVSLTCENGTKVLFDDPPYFINRS